MTDPNSKDRDLAIDELARTLGEVRRERDTLVHLLQELQYRTESECMRTDDAAEVADMLQALHREYDKDIAAYILPEASVHIHSQQRALLEIACHVRELTSQKPDEEWLEQQEQYREKKAIAEACHEFRDFILDKVADLPSSGDPYGENIFEDLPNWLLEYTEKRDKALKPDPDK